MDVPWTYVCLRPPSQLVQVFSESANHSGLRADQTAAVVESEEALRKGAMYAEVAEGGKEAPHPFLCISPYTPSLRACMRRQLR